MNPEPSPEQQDPRSTPIPRRLFLREPGWRVGLKVGNERAFCYMMAPGQDFYHRLLDGEVYVYHGDERICLACAERRGLLSFEARGLGSVPFATIFDDQPPSPSPHGSEFDLEPPPDL